MFWPSVDALLELVSRHSPDRERQGLPTIDQTIRETAQSHLAKQSKVELGHDAVMLEDLRALALADREKVRLYEAAKVPGQAAREGPDNEMGDIIICDAYHVQRWPRAAWAVVVAAALATAGLVASQYQGTQSTPAPDSPVVEATDTDTLYDLQFANEEAEKPNE